MRIKLRSLSVLGVSTAGFGLLDVLIGMAISGVMFVALYAGLAAGFQTIKIARENSRATQIMVEKMETIRLYNWDQITNNGYIPTNFTERYYPMNTTNAGIIYTGKVTIANSGLPTTYGTQMKKITVDINWTTGRLARRRSLSTYVARYGLQNYVY